MKPFTENNFDELFKEKFSNFGENPPEGILQRIKNTMSNIPQQVPFWKKGGFFAGIGGVIVLILGVIVINLFKTDKIESNNTLVNKVSIETNSSDNKALENKAEVFNTSNNNKLAQVKDIIPIQNKKTESTEDNKVIDNSINHNEATEVTPINKSISINNNTQNIIPSSTNYTIAVIVKAATCRKSNGRASLAANDQTVKFYWIDFDLYNVTNVKENLQSGTYNVKAVNNSGTEKLFKVIIPDSGIIRTRFTHYEMTQTIGVPVYFSNKTTVDGNNYEEIENISFKWYFGDGSTSNEPNPEYLYKATGPFVISLVANNSIGCKDSISSSPLYIAESDIDFPNIFTPNGDGVSDVFKPAVKGMSSFQCVIFNRDGKQIFEFTDPELGWDGKINHGLQMASPGTYYYVIKGVGVDGKFINHKQFLDLRY